MTGPVAQILESWNYLVAIALMMGGLFIVISQNNLVKKLVGLAISRPLSLSSISASARSPVAPRQS